jgi:tetratricopeptide (TPR) repeat protein
MILINTAIEFNNAAVRLQKEKKHAMALAKLRNAVNSLEAKEDDRETPQSPLHNDQMLQYKYDEGIRAFTFFLTTISHDDRHDKDYVEAVIAYNLGICCSLQNQFALASDYFADTHCYLCSRKFSHNDSNKKLQSSLVHLNEGHNYFRAGNYEEALDSYWDAVNQANQDGNKDLQIGAALNCIGATSFTSLLQENDLGQLTRRALAPLNGALSTFMDTCGEDGGPDTRRTYSFMATIVNNIGRVRFYVKDYEGALPFFKKAYLVRRSHYGENHIDVAISSLYMGLCLQNLGDADGAIIQYNCYLGIMLKDENLAYLEDFIDQIMHVADLFQKDNDLTAAIAFLKIAFFSVRQEITTKNNPTRLWGDHPIKI